MASDGIWRFAAIGLCLAVPASFYVAGDIADAFPGVLTVAREDPGPQAGPPAQAEGWERDSAAVPSGPVRTDPSEDAAGLADRMAEAAQLPVVDGNLAFSVVDAGTGDVLAARDADTARVPASTLKLLTAAATLRTVDGDDVLTTRAVVADGVVTLVGDGDMTLTEDDLAELAAGAAELAREQDAPQLQVAYDTSALPGGQNPAWGSNGVDGGWVAPTAALALDEGRLDGSAYGPKSTDPAGDAAERFAELLGEQDGIEVDEEVEEGTAPESGPEAAVESAPIAEIMRHTLLESDNTTAELLAHLVAREQGRDTTPDQAAAAVEEEMLALGAELGVPQADLDALVIRDGSGLSTENRVPPTLLAAVLADVSSGDVPELEQILYDVPIAGLSGTLADRFEDDADEPALGTVRGKTGYLGGAATLAGVAVLPDGRTVGYSIVVHGFDGEDAPEARTAVDAVAAEIVRDPAEDARSALDRR